MGIRVEAAPIHGRTSMADGSTGSAAGSAETTKAIALALDVSVSTVERVPKRFAEAGLEAALDRRLPRREYRRKLDGEQEAHLVDRSSRRRGAFQRKLAHDGSGCNPLWRTG